MVVKSTIRAALHRSIIIPSSDPIPIQTCKFSLGVKNDPGFHYDTELCRTRRSSLPAPRSSTQAAMYAMFSIALELNLPNIQSTSPDHPSVALITSNCSSESEPHQTQILIDKPTSLSAVHRHRNISKSQLHKQCLISLIINMAAWDGGGESFLI